MPSQKETPPVDNLFNADVPTPVAEVKAKAVKPAAPVEIVATADQLEAIELNMLKERADQMQVAYHPNIGLATLRAKIAAALNVVETVVAPVVVEAEPVPESVYEYRARMQAEAYALIRVVVNCMNPAKQLLPGEVFTVSNRIVGTVKKFVPFNVEAGYHIPQMIVNQLIEKKCQIFVTQEDPRTKIKTSKGKLINAFNVVVLPALTEGELKELAAAQAAANNID
jgi:hypothetical protein